MQLPIFRLLALAVIFVLSPITAAEPVPSPRYSSWAKCKPNTSITRHLENRIGTQTATSEIKHTLLEVTPDKVVLQLEMTFKTGGKVSPMPPRKVEFPAKIEKYGDLLGPDYKVAFTESRTETVEIGGRSLTCRVIDFQGDQVSRTPGFTIKVNGAVWVSEDIPGAIVQILQNSQITDKDGNIIEGVTNTGVASIDIKD